MDGYEESWNWIVQNSPIPYMVPLISGWDSRPWGGNTPHDMSFSTPKQFEVHLQRAKRLIDKYPQKTLRTAVICCWNEYGVGSYIEPTKKYQFAYLEAVKRVFGPASTQNIRTSD